MRVRRNALANYIGAGFATLGPILALPWYLSILGPSQYGLIGVMLLLQALLSMLDAGAGQALVREVALRLDVGNDQRGDARSLLVGFERVYAAVAIAAGFALFALSGPLTVSWLDLDGLPEHLGQQAIQGAAGIFCAQFPGAVYRSVLIGGQAQVGLSSLTAAATVLRHGGGVLVLQHFPAISTYVLWNIAVGLAETLVRRWMAWCVVNACPRVRQGEALRVLLPSMARLTAAALVGAVTVQIDKVYLSRMVSIEQFGYYSIAASVALGMLQFVYPLIQALLPRAVQAGASPGRLRALELRLACGIAASIVVLAAGFVLAGENLLRMWIAQDGASEAIYPLLGVLLVGTALNALYNVGYVHWLVLGRSDRIFQVNVFTLACGLLLLPKLISEYGSLGAAFGWVLVNAIGLVASAGWLRKQSSVES